MNRSISIRKAINPVKENLSVSFDQKVFDTKRRESRFLKIDFSKDFIESFNKFFISWLKKFSIKAFKRKATDNIERGSKKLKCIENKKNGNKARSYETQKISFSTQEFLILFSWSNRLNFFILLIDNSKF